MPRYTLRKRGCSVDLGWDPGGFGTFYAKVRGADPNVDLRIGVSPRLTRSIDEFEEWLGPFGPLAHAMRLRLLRDQANDGAGARNEEEDLLLDDLEARLDAIAIACTTSEAILDFQGSIDGHLGRGADASAARAADQFAANAKDVQGEEAP